VHRPGFVESIKRYRLVTQLWLLTAKHQPLTLDRIRDGSTALGLHRSA
jgi:hypothetical protein